MIPSIDVFSSPEAPTSRARAGLRVTSLAVIAAVLAVGCGSDDAPDDVPDPVADSVESGDADALPNACPAEGCTISILGVEPADGEITLTLDANFTPDFERNHMHVFWDSQEAGAVSSNFQDNGFDEQGKWHPTDEYPTYTTQADAAVGSEFRGGSTTLCVTAADTDHAVLDTSLVQCLDVSDLVG